MVYYFPFCVSAFYGSIYMLLLRHHACFKPIYTYFMKSCATLSHQISTQLMRNQHARFTFLKFVYYVAFSRILRVHRRCGCGNLIGCWYCLPILSAWYCLPSGIWTQLFSLISYLYLGRVSRRSTISVLVATCRMLCMWTFVGPLNSVRLCSPLFQIKTTSKNIVAFYAKFFCGSGWFRLVPNEGSSLNTPAPAVVVTWMTVAYQESMTWGDGLKSWTREQRTPDLSTVSCHRGSVYLADVLFFVKQFINPWSDRNTTRVL